MVDGRLLHLRVSDHEANGARMGNANADHKVSLVIRKNGEHVSTGEHDGYTEWVFEPSEVSPKDAANAIIGGVESLIRTGEFVDATGKAHRKDYPYTDNDGVVHYRVRRAPNGKESNLDERQYDEVRTDNFKKWFGDWERVAQRDYILSDKYVTSLKGDEFAKTDEPLTDRVAKYYSDNYDGQIERENFGVVILDRRGVKDSISHGIGRTKSAAFAAVPEIIRDGIQIDQQENWKGRNQDSFTFAAPIEIGGKGHVGIVVATRGKGSQRNRFYLHEVVIQENLQNESIKTGTKADSHHGDVAKVLKEIATAKNPSKIVDANGEPLVVWHGTDNDFFTFDRGRLGENTDFNADEIVGQSAHIGFWFNRGGEEMLDMTYSKQIPVYLDIKEPVEFTSLRALSDEIAMRGGAERFVDDMRDAGHDGVVVKDEEFGGTSYVAFDPTQIKSATENNGDFSRESGDIRFLPTPPGVMMRPCSFTPAAGRYQGERCYGYQIMLQPGAQYHSLLHTLQLMRFLSERYSQVELYDSLFVKVADPVIEEYLRGHLTFDVVQEHVKLEEQKWIRKAKRFLLYEDAPYRMK